MDYVNTIAVDLAEGSDPAALGGAVTVALCGHWDHDGDCVWPHFSSVSDDGDTTVLTTTFTAEPAEEPHVRRLIATALERGELVGPDGVTSRWTVR